MTVETIASNITIEDRSNGLAQHSATLSLSPVEQSIISGMSELFSTSLEQIAANFGISMSIETDAKTGEVSVQMNTLQLPSLVT